MVLVLWLIESVQTWQISTSPELGCPDIFVSLLFAVWHLSYMISSHLFGTLTLSRPFPFITYFCASVCASV